MMLFFKKIKLLWSLWRHDQSGIAATEFAIVFPMLIMMLLGTIELGQGILANQKTIMASQIVSDLLTRTEMVTDAQLEDAQNAGRLALSPFDRDTVGFDIVSIRFDPDSNDSGTEPDPVIVWRETDNMEDHEQDAQDIIDKVKPLGIAHDGLMVVYVRFPYEPVFGTRFVGKLNMIETTFSRGRKNPVVARSSS